MFSALHLASWKREYRKREREEKQRTNHSNKISNGTIKINLKIK
jgi:hypothetical protein